MSGAAAAFPIKSVIDRVREAVRRYPKAALFELSEEGYSSPFEILIACLLSVRTRDEVTLPVARRLFAFARTPAAVAVLAPEEIAAVIAPCAFAFTKACRIVAIARRAQEEYGGSLPCDEAVLLGLPGVGLKCAHLVLGIACGQPRVAVDVHVHRITNRWGYVATSNPEETTAALEARLPRDYWVEINALLVPFGKHFCTGARPRCSVCPVNDVCARVGVAESR